MRQRKASSERTTAAAPGGVAHNMRSPARVHLGSKPGGCLVLTDDGHREGLCFDHQISIVVNSLPVVMWAGEQCRRSHYWSRYGALCLIGVCISRVSSCDAVQQIVPQYHPLSQWDEANQGRSLKESMDVGDKKGTYGPLPWNGLNQHLQLWVEYDDFFRHKAMEGVGRTGRRLTQC